MRALVVVIFFGFALAVRGDAAEPYEIDVIASLTGPSAFIGQGVHQGLEAVEQLANKTGGIAGRPVHFVINDDQTNPQQSVAITNQLLTKNPAIILGGSFAAACRAMFPLSRNGPVMYCMTPAVEPAPGSFDFSSGVANRDLLRAGIRYFRERGWLRVATITTVDATGQDNDRAIDEALALPENSRMSLVDREHFAVSDLSVSAQIARVKGSGAQVLIIGTAGTPTNTIMRSISEVGLALPVGINYGNATHAQMTQLAPYLPKELYFFGVAFLSPGQVGDRATKRIVDVFDASLTALGYRPDASQSSPFEVGMLTVYALQKLGPAATAEQLRAFFANLKGYVGISGPYDFTAYPQRGLGPASATISRWDAQHEAFVGVSKPGGDVLR